jgi:hypothetical protein
VTLTFHEGLNRGLGVLHFLCFAGVLLAGLFLPMYVDEFDWTLTTRFAGPLRRAWDAEQARLRAAESELGGLIESLGLRQEDLSEDLVLDRTAYSFYWRTKAPIVLEYVHGWWATGVDYRRVMRENRRRVVLGECASFPPDLAREAARSPHGYCCKTLERH